MAIRRKGLPRRTRVRRRAEPFGGSASPMARRSFARRRLKMMAKVSQEFFANALRSTRSTAAVNDARLQQLPYR